MTACIEHCLHDPVDVVPYLLKLRVADFVTGVE